MEHQKQAVKYITLADVKDNNDRVCFYVGMESNGTVKFASKSSINGNTDSKKGNLKEVIGWIGFDQLGMALHKDKKFQKKYNIKVTNIIDKELKHVSINAENYFFFSEKRNNCDWIEIDPMDIVNNFDKNIELKINSIFGQNYLENLSEKNEKDKKEEADYKDKIKQTQQELKEIMDAHLNKKKNDIVERTS